MNQKKSKRKTKKSTTLPKTKLINIFLLIFLFAFLATTLSYFIMKNENPNKNVKSNNILEKETKKVKQPIKELEDFQEKKLNEYFDAKEPQNDKFEEYTDELHKDFEEKEVLETPKAELEKINDEIKKDKENIEEENNLNKEIKDIKEKINIRKNKEETKVIIPIAKKIDESKIITKKDTFIYDNKTKPKLVILIDDVSTSKQKEKILDIGYTVNMAFLPPTSRHPNSAKIAQDLPFHMIHFPMQASPAFKGEEINTLNITDSYETIEKRVKQLREWYPKVTYTNNHTGSVFTENEEAVDKLFRALKKYNFIFVDSRTSAKSVIKKYAKKYDMPYIVRNTFIDNNREYKAIETQLKKAIAIARSKGFAIAIGHPHDITLKVLKNSKQLLNGIETIYIKDLPYL